MNFHFIRKRPGCIRPPLMAIGLLSVAALTPTPAGAQIQSSQNASSIAVGNWTWLTGSNRNNQPGTYGTMGVPVATTWLGPGARSGHTMSLDADSRTLFMFGGFGYDGTGKAGTLHSVFCM